MSVATIQVPAEQVDAIRERLLAARHDLEEGSSRREQIDGLLRQLGPATAAREARELTGSRGELWRVVYDAACELSERIADDCNEYWRGSTAGADVRAEIAALAARFELLEAIGPPPREGGG